MKTDWRAKLREKIAKWKKEMEREKSERYSMKKKQRMQTTTNMRKDDEEAEKATEKRNVYGEW